MNDDASLEQDGLGSRNQQTQLENGIKVADFPLERTTSISHRMKWLLLRRYLSEAQGKCGKEKIVIQSIVDGMLENRRRDTLHLSSTMGKIIDANLEINTIIQGKWLH